MQPVPTHFTEGRFAYAQIHREGMLAIYTQTHRDGGATRYEVVRIRIAPAHTWPNGATTPEREVYPGATRWGQDAWSCHTQPEAFALFAALRARQEARVEEVPHG